MKVFHKIPVFFEGWLPLSVKDYGCNTMNTKLLFLVINLSFIQPLIPSENTSQVWAVMMLLTDILGLVLTAIRQRGYESLEIVV